MKNKSIKLRTLPSQKNRSTAWIVAVIFVVIFSYFVPGWHYLLDVRTHLVQRLSLNIVIPLLLCFYLLIFIVFYRIILELFSKNAVLEISEANVLTLFVNGYGKLVINKDQLEIDKNFIKVLGQEKFDFMFKNKDVAALLREKPANADHDRRYSKQKSFIGGFRGLVQLSVYSTFLLIFYIVTAFYGHKFVTPYIADLQILFRAKGALLMIIISIPLIFFYLSFAYYFFTKIVFRKKAVRYNFRKSSVTLSQGRFELNMKAITKTVFFINSVSGYIDYMIIYRRSKRNFLIYAKTNDINFQNFVNEYRDEFGITDENINVVFSSPESKYHKKILYHD